MVGLRAGGAGAAVPAVQERLLLSLLWTGWPTPKPEIICKMEQEEMQCIPDPLSAQRMHQTPFAGGYRVGDVVW